ncbi:MAG: hypothetical protein AAF702_28740 [Chloroflexota bacterium]
MWAYKMEEASKPHTLKVNITKAGRQLSFADILRGWQVDDAFRTFYIDLLASTPFEAIFWEMPAISRSTISRPYEFIVAESTHLASVTADVRAFNGYFRGANPQETIVAFENLGGDAMLVAPCPIGPQCIYPHLAKFVRKSEPEQTHAFFHRLGEEVTKRLSERPLWVSTSGLGVYWLHARLDSTPKYYTYAPYRVFTSDKK